MDHKLLRQGLPFLLPVDLSYVRESSMRERAHTALLTSVPVVGQQWRLQIATLVARPADLLVLDEPTNHVALDLVEDLQAALAAYPVGAVSHDRGFRARFGAERLGLRAGRRR